MAFAPYSKEIVEGVKRFFDEKNTEYYFREELDGEAGIIIALLGIRTGLRRLRCIVDVRNDCYTVCASPFLDIDTSDKALLASLAEFVCRANCGLTKGLIELDMDNGTISYRYCVNFVGPVPEKTLQESIYFAVIMFESYGDGLLNVIINGADAKEEAERCKSTF